jgi:nucleotide-binding universal stress UspA family protein
MPSASAGVETGAMKGKVILVAVDESPAAHAAVGASLELAAALGSPLRFVHATALSAALFEEHREQGPSRDEIAARDTVLGDALAHADAAGVEAELEVMDDTSGAELAASMAGIAEGLDAGLIVVGSRGRGALAGAVLGSVSQNLIKYASRPVLIVHGPPGA